MSLYSRAITLSPLFRKNGIVGLNDTGNHSKHIVRAPHISVRSAEGLLSGAKGLAIAIKLIEVFCLAAYDSRFLDFPAAPMVKRPVAVYLIYDILLCISRSMARQGKNKKKKRIILSVS